MFQTINSCLKTSHNTSKMDNNIIPAELLSMLSRYTARRVYEPSLKLFLTNKPFLVITRMDNTSSLQLSSSITCLQLRIDDNYHYFNNNHKIQMSVRFETSLRCSDAQIHIFKFGISLLIHCRYCFNYLSYKGARPLILIIVRCQHA